MCRAASPRRAQVVCETSRSRVLGTVQIMDEARKKAETDRKKAEEAAVAKKAAKEAAAAKKVILRKFNRQFPCLPRALAIAVFVHSGIFFNEFWWRAQAVEGGGQEEGEGEGGKKGKKGKDEAKKPAANSKLAALQEMQRRIREEEERQQRLEEERLAAEAETLRLMQEEEEVSPRALSHALCGHVCVGDFPPGTEEAHADA